MSKISFCSTCLAMSTRPRISFDKDGKCNACVWSEKKKTLNWTARGTALTKLLDKSSDTDKPYDIIVPVSGGKDGSYVAYQLKHKYNLRPLCVTVRPPLETDIGVKNLRNFIDSGYDHISINLDPVLLKKINKSGFMNHGFPYFGWLVAINTAVARIAEQFNVELIMYGEDGEMEYGGTSEKASMETFDMEFIKRVGHEAGFERVFGPLNIESKKLYWYTFPEPVKFQPKFAHWSYFENWDPYRNYLVAKEFCGLQEAAASNSGTFTNFAQNDQYLYILHTYLMYLKYGFGRANQDACIDIRRGAMDREQAINLVKLFDGNYPHDSIELYLDYYQLNKKEFDSIIDKWANKDILVKDSDGIWKRNFEIE